MLEKALVLGVLAVSAGACGLMPSAEAPTPDVSTVVAATMEAISTSTALASSPTPAGASFSSNGVSLVIPVDVAGGAAAENIPAATEQTAGPWQAAPAYVRLTLQGYTLQDKFFQPQVMVYPAQEYAAASSGAATSISRLDAILQNPSAPLTNDVLPRLPFANAEQIIAGAPKVISFKNGSGVRVLAEYAQYFAQINNEELFYHFEGLTSDGKFYIVTTLPINADFLAPGSDQNSPAPADGVPFPGYDNTDSSVFDGYYKAVADKLNATPPDSFRPSLSSLDALIATLEVTQ
jgi:hypothetical protein